jgi:ABC-type branched-chain amino acid transport systems, ATPase component
MTHLLDTEDLAVKFDGKIAVDGVSIHVAPREIVVVVGHNGAGKSTTVNAVHGHVKATGTVRYRGEDISSWSAEKRLSAGISLVPQGHQVFGPLSVRENLLIGGMRKGKDSAADLERMYEIFPILRERSKQRASTLSGGQQQMLAIAMGLIVEPELLLVDEPSIGLAPALVERVMESLKTARDTAGCGVLLVEQNIAQSFAIADRVYGMRRGSVVAEAPPADFTKEYDLMEIM